ncbi:MAG: fumarylacetoacetate hydrolase family protein [Deltaproteobacteria bacterium]|nr:fumarylacetoacetate hydrolase family protein [Deltaproteobacteria bacterium]
MRLVTFTQLGETRLGALLGEHVVDLNRAYGALLRDRSAVRPEALAEAVLPADMRGLLDGEEKGMSAAHAALEFVTQRLTAQGSARELRRTGIIRDLKDVALRAPILNPRKLILLGLNYRDHAEEAKMKLPEVPILFNKYNNAIIGPGEPIVIPRATSRVDYEAELAFVIGRRGKEVPREQAYEYVAGYMCLNDVSGRDYQMATTQWMVGKTFDTFCPMGPHLVTRDEVPDPHVLDIKCVVNGEVMQHSNTKYLIFGVPEIIEYISTVFTIEPGDVVATGTPGGVGFVRKPPRWLKPGEQVRVEVEGVGILENPVAA